MKNSKTQKNNNVESKSKIPPYLVDLDSGTIGESYGQEFELVKIKE